MEGVSSAQLSPYQVCLCCLLLQYAQGGPGLSGNARRRLFELLFREIQAPKSLRHRSLRDIQRGLQAFPEGVALWEEFQQRILSLDSPDALFTLVRELEAAVSKEVSTSSPLHSGGIFGQFARHAILAFKEASFEAIVKLYEALRSVLETPEPMSANAADVKHGAAATSRFALGSSRIEQLAQGLARDIPESLGRVPFPEVEASLRTFLSRVPMFHRIHFLKYLNFMQHRMVSDAVSSLRCFHEGHQQWLTSSSWNLNLPDGDGLPDLVQYATLSTAGLHYEMRQLDSALQSIDESVRAAQEASDSSCLCMCLHWLSLVLLQAGHVGKAFTMLRRCLHRAEAIGHPTLQALCCLGIAHALSISPSLFDRRKGAHFWKDTLSSTLSTSESPLSQAALANRPNMAGGRPSGAGNNDNNRGGLSVLAALLCLGPDGQTDTTSQKRSSACRDALAHATLASHLSSQVGSPGEQRPKVLLCQAEVARLFGLQHLATASSKLALNAYEKHMAAEDLALGLCQLASAKAAVSFEEAQPLLRSIAQRLPYATHLWAHVVGHRLIQALAGSGEVWAVSVLLFQLAGIVHAVPHNAAMHAAHLFRSVANEARLRRSLLLGAYLSAREAVEANAVGAACAPSDLCTHLLCLTDIHLEANDPVGALVPCLRCLSLAEGSQMTHMRVEALVRLAKAKLEMGDAAQSLQILEGASPHVIASGSSRLRAEMFAAQADVLLQLATSHAKDQVTKTRLLREVVALLSRAVEEYEKVAELTHLRRCLYLLARTCHEVGDNAKRDLYAAKFRRISDFFNGRKQLDASPKSALHILMQPCKAAPAEAYLGSSHSGLQPASSPAPAPVHSESRLGSHSDEPLEHLNDLIAISGNKKESSVLQSRCSYPSNGLRELYPIGTVLSARA